MKIKAFLLFFALVAVSVLQAQEADINGVSSQPSSHQQETDLGVCPVMGGKAVKDYSYEYQGKTYYFCCQGCLPAFKKNPEKYIEKMAD